MLSRENQSKLSETELAILFHDAAIAARQLGHQLIKGERNPDPMREREAPNPADGVRIRIIRPQAPTQQLGYDVEGAKQHNTYVETLGRAGRKQQ